MVRSWRLELLSSRWELFMAPKLRTKIEYSSRGLSPWNYIIQTNVQCRIKLIILLKQFYLITFFFPIFYFLACANKEDVSQINKIVNKKINFVFTSKIKIDESNHIIGKIGWNAFVDRKKYIYILDVKNLKYLKYSPNGKFLFEIGKKGQGPGEYLEPHHVFVDCEGRVYIFDISKFTTVVYDSNGVYINEIKYSTGIPFPGIYYSNKNIKIVSFFNYQRSSFLDKVKFFHFLDSNYKIYKSVSITYPPIYKQFNLINYQSIYWCFVKNEFYVLFAALPYIYKYDIEGKLKLKFGMPPSNFNIVNQNVNHLSLREKIKLLSRFSVNNNLFCIKDKFLLQIFSNTELPKTNNIRSPFELNKYRKFYFQLYTTNGEAIELKDNKMPGIPLYCTNKGEIYLLLKDVPFKREIAIYEIKVQ